MKKQFLLGADDPEMQAMERILTAHKIPFSYASVRKCRAQPGNAYRVDTVTILHEHQLVVIECAFDVMPDSTIVIDHHRPGDPGFALGPDRFWEASSIGQLHKLLRIEPTRHAIVMAAFDHCFAAAVQGGCEGVSNKEVIHLRLVELSSQTGVSGADIWKRVIAFRKMVAQAPELIIGGQVVKDLRGEYLGEGYSLDYLTAQLAVVMEGHAALLRHRDAVRAAEKCTITGHAAASTIEAFMNTWAPSQGLERIFGVPDRGYAGGYPARRHSSRTA